MIDVLWDDLEEREAAKLREFLVQMTRFALSQQSIRPTVGSTVDI